MKKHITIALAGQPNVGKSSIINKISGSNLKVGNFTGVTIEKAYATFEHQNYSITIIDLPGTYSLNQYTQEEKITQDFLLNENYDVILNVLDSTNLERNLALTAQILELDRKTIVALNMNDEAQKEGIQIDEKQLSNILGVPCVKVTSSNSSDMQKLLEMIIRLYEKPFCPSKRTYSECIEEEIKTLSDHLIAKQYPCVNTLIKEGQIINYRKLSISLLQQNEEIYQILSSKPCWVELAPMLTQSISRICKVLEEERVSNIFNLEHYAYAKGASLEVQNQKPRPIDKTQKIDSILLNKYLGIPIFLFLMWLLFQATFTLGAIPKEGIEECFAFFGELAKEYIPSPALSSLIADGIIGGVGAVVSFLPDILILFLGIVILEGSGYMARIAFLLDGFFHRFGLHGKSFIPLVTGFGCSVPAFMSTRMLKNRGDKMLTLFIINFMSCGARLPVYVLFIGAFFPQKHSGNILFGIYILGALVGLVMAKILKLTAFRGIDEPFVMEMPKYRFPSAKLIAYSVWNKAKMYLKKAGTFILGASMLIWFSTQYPKHPQIEARYESEVQTLEQKGAKAEEIEELEHQKEALLLEKSYLGYIGEGIAPLFAPFDFDWKLSVSLISGLAAKETMISTMGVLYSLGEDLDESSQDLKSTLAQNISIPTAIAFILFVMFYNPCLAATIVFGKEAGGRKYVFYLFLLTSLTAYVFALIGYNLTKLFF
ncbi:ferrous iron transport protein B [Helicobacter brantae]|uniref:Ferrous iron transport protein B n=1 Tax=Helicobacter brantae TaxID=375927 RepID=A0A3D8IWN4_9HELI|nr:ferrous iron transport protein B [Helicobacter brantae]RDU69390.1 ferrous iron transport protein B [Helicobacter brantae]